MERRFSDSWDEMSGEEMSDLLDPIGAEAPDEVFARRVAAKAAEKMNASAEKSAVTADAEGKNRMTAVPECKYAVASGRKKKWIRTALTAAAVAAFVLLGACLKPLLSGRIPAENDTTAGQDTAASVRQTAAPEESVPVQNGSEKILTAKRLTYVYQNNPEEERMPEANQVLFAGRLFCFDGETRLFELDLDPFYIDACLELENGVLLTGWLQAKFWEKDEVGRTVYRDFFEYKGRRWSRLELSASASVPWMIRLDEKGNILWEKELCPEGEDEAYWKGKQILPFGAAFINDSGFAVFSAVRNTEQQNDQTLLIRYYDAEGTWEKTRSLPIGGGYPEEVFGTADRFVVVMKDQKGSLSRILQLDTEGRLILAEEVPKTLFPEESLFYEEDAVLWDQKIWFSLHELSPDGSLSETEREAARQYVENWPTDWKENEQLTEKLTDPLYDGSYPGEAGFTKSIKESSAALLYSYDIKSGKWQAVFAREGSVGAQLYFSEEDVLVWETLEIKVGIPAPFANSYNMLLVMQYQKSGFSPDGRLLSESDGGPQAIGRILSMYLIGPAQVPSWYAKERKQNAENTQALNEEPPVLTLDGPEELQAFLTLKDLSAESLSRYGTVKEKADYDRCLQMLAVLPDPVCDGWEVESLTLYPQTGWAKFYLVKREEEGVRAFSLGLCLAEEDPWKLLNAELEKHEKPTAALSNANVEALYGCPGEENNGLYWYWGIAEGHYFSLSLFSYNDTEEVGRELAESLAFGHFEIPENKLKEAK
ncbi:MAG: hypothetical protein J5496_01105 [Lachnospiraceae bacterium]|nr:hypothetical protein [Lachnospiraceae bacterium]